MVEIWAGAIPADETLFVSDDGREEIMSEGVALEKSIANVSRYESCHDGHEKSLTQQTPFRRVTSIAWELR